MLFYSLNRKSKEVSFQEAVLQGLAPDGGLYFPKVFPRYSPSEIKRLKNMTLIEIGIQLMNKWVGDEFTRDEISAMVSPILTFPIPIKELDNLLILELFHGPTLAFKDFGAGLLGQILNVILSKNQQKATILVATSGDTGGAVAAGLSGMSNVNLAILYPYKQVSSLQLEQLTRCGENVLPISIEGDFDDCQSLVKQAFRDKDLLSLHLTSANSVNIGRLIPQSLYYIYAYSRIQNDSIQFIVPSGNMGNITAALFAREMGLPFNAFVIATNANDTVVNFFNDGIYKPQKTVHTLSTAMDIGNPSNFIRMLELFGNHQSELKKIVQAISIDTDLTIKIIQEVYNNYHYLLDPHTAVGYAAAKCLNDSSFKKVILSTASPFKFADEIFKSTGIKVDNKKEITNLQKRKKHNVLMKNDYTTLKQTLLNTFG